MQQTRKLKCDFSAATILALVTLAMNILLTLAPCFLYRIPFNFTYYFIDGSFLLDAIFVFWFVACLLRNNQTVFRILATVGFAARLLYVLVRGFIAVGSVWNLAGNILEIVFCILMVLCVLNVIKGTTAPVIIIAVYTILDTLFVAMDGFIVYITPPIFILSFITTCVFSASIICAFLSNQKQQRVAEKQKQELNRQQIEQLLWRLKQHYEAKQISEQQYAYWKEELLKKL